MRRLTPSDVMNLCAEFAAAPALARADALIALACPEADSAATPGARNAQLMQIRRTNLGRRMACLTPCRACGDMLEIELDTLDFAGAPLSGHVTVDDRGHSLVFRLPTPRDVADAARSDTPLITLIGTCAVDLPPHVQLTDDLLQKIEDAYDVADPLGCIVIAATCPTCDAVTQPVLDPTDLVWREFAALALRIEDDVHVLARAYGWTEGAVLALPDVRRRRYVERVMQ